MCGDLEPEDTASLATYRRIAAGLRQPLPAPDAPPDADIATYMATMFDRILAHACADAESAAGSAGDLLFAQSMVLARAAGRLAREIDLHEDPLKNLIEALMDGYAGAGAARGGQHHLDHHHDHPHGEGHHHHHA